jgi:hypothetical protein
LPVKEALFLLIPSHHYYIVNEKVESISKPLFMLIKCNDVL